jgi:hypothetical protein
VNPRFTAEVRRRATVGVLQINRLDAVLVREALIEEGVYPAEPKRARD